jgi:hypothetical protein
LALAAVFHGQEQLSRKVVFDLRFVNTTGTCGGIELLPLPRSRRREMPLGGVGKCGVCGLDRQTTSCKKVDEELRPLSEVPLVPGSSAVPLPRAAETGEHRAWPCNVPLVPPFWQTTSIFASSMSGRQCERSRKTEIDQQLPGD